MLNKVCFQNQSYSTIKTILQSLGAGIAIAIGTLIYLNCNNSYVGAFLFSFGLLSVFFCGFNLYTGKIGFVTSVKEIPFILLVYLGNAIGSSIALLGNYEKAVSIMETKLQKPLPTVFFMAVVCGIIIHLCVIAFIKGVWQVSVIGVPLFILCGAEHSIADICFCFASHQISIVFILIVTVGNAVGAIVIDKFIKK